MKAIRFPEQTHVLGKDQPQLLLWIVFFAFAVLISLGVKTLIDIEELAALGRIVASLPPESPRPEEPPVSEHIEQFFAYEHLPPHLQAVSKPFAEVARNIILTLPRNPERTVSLRKLLEAKDAAVRAQIAKE